jgi:hypothetical protein
MYAYITPHIITPHIHIQERGWDSIGVMANDWQENIALTEVDAGFQDKRDLFTEHLRLVSGSGQCGARKFRWLKNATDCRPDFV